MTRTRVIAGNWKMNKTISEGMQFLDELKIPSPVSNEIEVMIFPSATSLYSLSRYRSDISWGVQNIHEHHSGAFTGEISAQMAQECCSTALIGHSERRHIFLESDERINQKIRSALDHHLRPMFCVGETLDERQQDRTDEVVLRQITRGLNGIPAEKLKDLMIAYEPVWAIGTGLTASPAQAQAVHALIRKSLTALDLGNILILYGGSVKPDNARDLLDQADVDGLLIGGASLHARHFSDIIASAYEVIS